ncbi:MAG: DUF4259 domain-containing protein [Spirochaetales bacterium]|nr:DUF4259 domain-containing protein [Spirochaetales bacterium]
MGTWDIGFFDNDMACDWENGIKENKNLNYIKDTFIPILENKEDTLDIDLANKALAAAETLAKLLGKESEHSTYTKHADNWSETFSGSIDNELIEIAIKSVEKIISSDSELLQYWLLRGEKNEWLNRIEDLKYRLKS